MSIWRFPIYRSNETQLRVQIMNALQAVGLFPVVKTTVEEDDVAVIPAGYQLLAYHKFKVSGSLRVDGQLVVLDHYGGSEGATWG